MHFSFKNSRVLAGTNRESHSYLNGAKNIISVLGKNDICKISPIALKGIYSKK